MTSFVNDSGEYLQYNGPDITVNKQAVSFFGFQIKGDFSQNFTIDNNSYNRGILGYQSAMQVGNPAVTKNIFTLVIDGNRAIRGFIVITDVDSKSISGFFISGNSSWFNVLSVNLKDMDWEEFAAVWGQAPLTTTGIRFSSSVDWGYNGLKRGLTPTQYIVTERVGFAGLFPVDTLSDTYPAMMLYRIVQKIGNETGIKITGNILSDPIFLKIAITGNGPDLKWPTSQTEPYRLLADRTTTQVINNLDTLNFDNIVSEGEKVNYLNGLYTSRISATYRVKLILLLLDADSYEFYIEVNLYAGGSAEYIIFPDTLGSQSSYSGTAYLNLALGDAFDVKVRSIGVARSLLSGSEMLVEISEKIEPISYYPSGSGLNAINYVSASAIVPNIKAIDLIKFITNYFNCICYFDVEENKITLTKLNSVTETEDWSDYYISHNETYNRIATNNYITFLPSSEIDIVRYNEVHDLKFGGGNIITDSEIKKDNTLYQIPFGAAYDQLNKTTAGGTQPFIEFFKLTDSPDISIEYSSVTDDGSGNAQFNHAGNADANFHRVYRIFSNSGWYSGYAVNNNNVAGSPSLSTFAGINFLANDTGRIIAQEAQRITGPHRLLLIESNGLAYFDSEKISLAISNIEGRNSNTIGELFHQKLSNGFNSPLIAARMKLPQTIYQNFNFDKFVRVKAKDLDGLFYVNKISSYKNSRSECLVELIFM